MFTNRMEQFAAEVSKAEPWGWVLNIARQGLRDIVGSSTKNSMTNNLKLLHAKA